VNDVPFVAHPDLQRAIIFHGHYCPGLVIGYRASVLALRILGAERSGDEELVAVVENDSCAVDSVQVLTGCTFGKGNLFFRDFGKHVYTFAVRPSGHAVRLSLRPRTGGNNADLSREHRASALLEAADEELFDIRELTVDLPHEAVVRRSVICDACGEAVMDSRAHRRGRRLLCHPCAETTE
jgi:formylmethanofuran dehydrogenase subunit E